jgi:hypothetical protein
MNKHTVRYFDTITGSEIGAAHALDRNGVLRDGFTMRVPMRFRDAGPRGVPLKSQDAKPQFTDGSNIVDPAAGLKPGWRMPTVQDRSHVHDAYAADAAYQRNRYKCGDGERLCDDCGGEGYVQDGNVCDTCRGEGVMSKVEDKREPGKSLPDPASDHRPLDHKSRMHAEYTAYDRALAEQWKQR